MNEEIGKLLAKAEQLGAEGNVDEAQKVLQEVEKVRTKKKDAEVRQHIFHLYFVTLFPCTNCHIILLYCEFVVLSGCFLFRFIIWFVWVFFFFFTGRVQELYARLQFPAAEVACL